MYAQRAPELYRHPFYPPLSVEALRERDRLLSLCREPVEGPPSRGALPSPRSSSSSNSGSSSRIYWGGLDAAKGRCKVRRSCLGFTADGNRVVAGVHDSLVAAAAATLSVHLNVGAPGVGLVLPHPIHPDLVAVGCLEDGCCRVLPAAVSLAPAEAAGLQLPVLQGSAVAAAAAGAAGEVFAVGGADGSIQVLNSRSLSSVASFPKAEGPVQTLSLSSSGTLLAWADKRPSAVEKEEPLLRRLDEGPRPSQHKLSLAAVSPAELLLQLHLAAAVTATAFHPHRDVLAFACDVDSSSSSRYSSSSSKNLAILALD
ncbi:hypothetical protein Efla_007375 [Eimeria flavescens]